MAGLGEIYKLERGYKQYQRRPSADEARIFLSYNREHYDPFREAKIKERCMQNLKKWQIALEERIKGSPLQNSILMGSIPIGIW